MSVDPNFKGKVDWGDGFIGKYKTAEVGGKLVATIQAKKGGKQYTVTVTFTDSMNQPNVVDYLKMTTTKEKIGRLIDQQSAFKEMHKDKNREVIVTSTKHGDRVLVRYTGTQKADKSYSLTEWHTHYQNKLKKKEEALEVLGDKGKEKETTSKDNENINAKLERLKKRIQTIEELAHKHKIKLPADRRGLSIELSAREDR
jgi:mannitol/fructose-specific phosphotransferase system IIA component (Ntr-type)